MNFKNILYALSCLSFSIIIGAGVYEHTAIWPHAFSEPPRSLTMFQGPYHLNAALFWQSIHPITMALLVSSLIFSWKTKRKKYVLITLAGYVVVLLTTFVFFVPELLELTGIQFSDTVDASLQARGSRWITLSLVRAGILIVLAVNLLLGLTEQD
jgi:hypothetical protein